MPEVQRSAMMAAMRMMACCFFAGNGCCAHHGNSDEYAFQSSEQAAQAERIDRSAIETGGLPRNRRRQAQVQKLEPDLQHREKTNQPISFVAHVTDKLGQHNNADQRDISLPEVIGKKIAPE